MGYQVAETLEAIESIQALEMALATLDQPVEGLIHHSDRGPHGMAFNTVAVNM